MYIRSVGSDQNYEYFDVLCWCGHVFEQAMVWPTEEEIECEKCGRKLSWNQCIQLSKEEWNRATDFRPMQDCHDCGAKPGEVHDPGCDTEVCPFCGGQAMCCGCPELEDANEEDLIPWDGEWPNVKTCRIYNLYSRARDKNDPPGPYWIPCDKDDPRGGEDLNTLYSKCVWNPTVKRRVATPEFLRELDETDRKTNREMGKSPKEAF